MPITTNRDKVRQLIGDTDTSDLILADDQIDYYLTSRSVVYSESGTIYNVPAAAADAAGAIAAKYSREFNFGEDGQRFDRAQRVGHYLSLQETLRSRAGGYSFPVTTAGSAIT